ncbi:MAG: hypothetical protein ACKVQV_15020 [Bacteroidia bacterium]
MKKEVIIHLFLATISLALFIYFDSLSISLNKIKNLLPDNRKEYVIFTSAEPYSFFINYDDDFSTNLNDEFDGSEYCTIEGGNNFSQGFSYLIKNITPDSLRKVSITAKVKRNEQSSFEFVFVISIENKEGENVFWDAVYTNIIDFPVNNWVTLNGERNIPASADDPENIIKIYPWNKGETEISIDDFVVIFGKQEERKGKDVELSLVDNDQVISESTTRKYNSLSAESKGITFLTKNENLLSKLVHDKKNSIGHVFLSNERSVHLLSAPSIKGKTENKYLNILQEQNPLLFISKKHGFCLSSLSKTKKSITIQQFEYAFELIKEIPLLQFGKPGGVVHQQAVINSIQNQSETHILLYESGAIQLSSLDANGNTTLTSSSLSQLCPNGVNSFIPIIDPETQYTTGIGCVTKDRSYLYLLQLEKQEFKIRKIKINVGVDITEKSTLFLIRNSDYILFNNDWRFELRKVSIQKDEIIPLERLDLISQEKNASPKYYESQTLTISKSNSNSFMIVVSCNNKSNENKGINSLKNKIEFFNIQL